MACAGPAEGGRACIILCAYVCLNKRRVLSPHLLSCKCCVPQPSRYHLLRLAPFPRRAGAGCGSVTNGPVQAKHDEKHRRTGCRVRLQERVTLPLAGNNHIHHDFSRGSRFGSPWPLTVDR